MQIIYYLEKMWMLASEGNTQGVFFWASLYTLLMMLYSLMFQFKVSSWPSTNGKLIEKDITEFGYSFAPSGKEYRVKIAYKYTVDDCEYFGNRLSPWLFVTSNNATFILKKQLNKIANQIDGSVKVFYNPKNPGKSFLIKPGTKGKLITGVLSVVPPILYWLKYYS